MSKIFMMAAALRKDSTNKKLIKIAANLVKKLGATVDLAEFSAFDMPLFNGDVLDAQGLPEGAKQFISRMKQADKVIISSPEYNFSVPGTLKNLVDWVSRDRPMPWTDKEILLLSASPSMVGGYRGLLALRVPLECCGAFVYPDMFSLALAYEAFNEKGELIKESTLKRLEETLSSFYHTHIIKK